MSRRTEPRDWECMECGRMMTAAVASRAYFGSGCPRCGGTDIFLAAPDQAERQAAERGESLDRVVRT